MPAYIDQMKRTVQLDHVPSRIISLVPSQSELLYYLGLENETVGITKFCIHPAEWHKNKIRVGGTKTVDIERVKSLSPDLIIGNKEENSKEDIAELSEIAPVWMSDIMTFEDAKLMILEVGSMTNKCEESLKLLNEIDMAFDDLSEKVRTLKIKKRVIYIMWHNPSMAAGCDTFINSMLKACGFINAVDFARYEEDKGLAEVDLVLLSSEPFPFKEKHFSIYQEKYPNAQIMLVDGEMFTWYGSRMKVAPSYFIGLLDDLMA